MIKNTDRKIFEEWTLTGKWINFNADEKIYARKYINIKAKGSGGSENFLGISEKEN